MIKVKLIHQDKEQEQAYQIREIVFVLEQQVTREEEYDEFEAESKHFLALDELTGKACGTARWRFTDKGVKLERFAVLPEYRSQGVGSTLVAAILENIEKNAESKSKKIYLHAQVTAMNLYRKFGFEQEGELFYEAGIEHYLMVKK